MGDEPSILPPVGAPAGFPACPKCPYVRTGPARVCLECARKTFEDIAPKACAICSQKLDPWGTCPNWLCHRSDRKIDRISAIAYLSGELHEKIKAYKYDGLGGWGLIFGRLVLGWLESHSRSLEVDLIIANPSYDPSGGIGHTENVLAKAEQEDILGTWPFDVSHPRALIKAAPTPKSAGSSAEQKRLAAEALKKVLRIPEPARIRNKRILVYDDVCTTGSQLNTIAEVLLSAGASSVEGLVLARTVWKHDS